MHSNRLQYFHDGHLAVHHWTESCTIGDIRQVASEKRGRVAAARGRVFVDGFAVFRLSLLAADGVGVTMKNDDGAVDDADGCYYYWSASASFVFCAW